MKHYAFVASAGAYKADDIEPMLVEGDERKASAGHVSREALQQDCCSAATETRDCLQTRAQTGAFWPHMQSCEICRKASIEPATRAAPVGHLSVLASQRAFVGCCPRSFLSPTCSLRAHAHGTHSRPPYTVGHSHALPTVYNPATCKWRWQTIWRPSTLETLIFQSAGGIGEVPGGAVSAVQCFPAAVLWRTMKPLNCRWR